MMVITVSHEPCSTLRGVSALVHNFAQRLSLATLIGAGAASVLGAGTFTAGAWQLDVTVAPEQPAIMLGEPGWLAFSVRNLTEENLQILVGGDYRNALGRPDSFKVRVVRDDGTAVAQPAAGFNMGGMVGPQALPARGTYTFRLFLPHWATFDAAGSYVITCERKLEILQAQPGKSFGELKPAEVEVMARTTIQVIPRDDTAMGEVIRRLGERMIANVASDDARGAARELAAIDDVRVVPWFCQAVDSKSYDMRFIGLRALSKFASDEAFEAIKRGMATRGSDFDPSSATRPELLEQSAANVRHAAVIALERSKHPDARAFLLAQRHDSYVGVRISILHVLGKMPPDEALPILREMSSDENERVRDEAERYIALLTAAKNAPPESGTETTTP